MRPSCAYRVRKRNSRKCSWASLPVSTKHYSFEFSVPISKKNIDSPSTRSIQTVAATYRTLLLTLKGEAGFGAIEATRPTHSVNVIEQWWYRARHGYFECFRTICKLLKLPSLVRLVCFQMKMSTESQSDQKNASPHKRD